MRHDVSHDGKMDICSLCVLFHQEKLLHTDAVMKEVSVNGS